MGDGVVAATEQRQRDAKAILEFEEDAHRAALEDNPDDVHVDWRTWAAIFFMAVSFGPPVGIAFGSVAAVIVPVAQELNGFDQLAWAVGAWAVGTACSFSIGGPLSDTFGRRWPILVGQLLTIVGYVLGGAAKEIGALIAAEAFVGFGCGLIFVSYAGVPEMLPNKYRSLGLGILDGGVALPWGVVAVVFGQALVENGNNWRWIFWTAVVVEAIGFAGTFLFYRPTSRPRADFEKTRLQQLAEIDLVGLTLFVGGLCSFLIGVTWGNADGPHFWDGASVVAPAVVGIAGMAAAFVYDFTVAKDPLFPPALFSMFREYTLLLIVIFVAGMLYSSLLPLLTQGSAYMFTRDGVEIGLMSLPYTVMTLIVGAVVPLFAHKIGHMKHQVVAASALQAAFIGATAGAVYPTNNYWAWIFLPAFGIPMFTWLTVLTYAVASLHVPHSRLGLAMGLMGTFRSAGGGVGNAIFSTIFKNRFNAFLAEELIPQIFVQGYNASEIAEIIPGAILYNQGVPFQLMAYPEPAKRAFQLAVRTAYGHAFKIVFLCTIPFSGIALICTFFIADPTVYMTNHVQMAMGRKEFREGPATPDPEAVAPAKEVPASLATKDTGEKPVTPTVEEAKPAEK